MVASIQHAGTGSDVGATVKLRHPPTSCLALETFMILELADIRIHPGQNAAFEAAIERGLKTVIQQVKGFRGFKVNRGVENSERYLLHVFWDTLEDHIVGFRQSAAFAEWRAIVGPFFAGVPVVEHFTLVSKSV
jgi:heme-degrading monooxygenase HmoA